MCLVNCTENQTNSCELYAELSTYVKCIKTFAYSLVMLVSLFGNLAVIAIISKNKRMWTTTNCLIALGCAKRTRGNLCWCKTMVARRINWFGPV